MLRSVLGSLLRRADARSKPAAVESLPPAASCPPEELHRVRSLLAKSAVDRRTIDVANRLVARYPACAGARLLLGEALRRARKPVRALEEFEHVLAREPQSAPALLGQGLACLDLDRKDEAADSLEMVLALDASNVEAHFHLGVLYQEAGAPKQAVEHFEALVTLHPDHAEAWQRLASCRQVLGESEAARSAYERALALEPRSVSAHINFGVFHLDCRGDPRAAEQLFRTAATLAPGEVAAQANLGLALQEQGRFEEALGLYRRASARAGRHAELRWNRALAHLLQGHFAAGWRDYEARFDRDGGRARRKFPFAPWTGTLPLQGSLLVYAEQGLGDEIMFASCIPDLARAGVDVVLECDRRLEAIFRRSFANIRIHGADRDGADRDGKREWLREYPELRWQVPIGSLPRYLRNAAEDFPSEARYLQADRHDCEQWRRRLSVRAGEKAVGICWRGGTAKTRTVLRSLALPALEPLLSLPDTRIVCLQHDVNDDEASLLRRFGCIVPELPRDMDAMAALVDALDVVVSVPSTTAHLAGALGVPLFVMVSVCPDWRWQWRGSQSPWHPSARLFRQEQPLVWSQAVERIVEESKSIPLRTASRQESR